MKLKNVLIGASICVLYLGTVFAAKLSVKNAQDEISSLQNEIEILSSQYKNSLRINENLIENKSNLEEMISTLYNKIEQLEFQIEEEIIEEEIKQEEKKFPVDEIGDILPDNNKIIYPETGTNYPMQFIDNTDYMKVPEMPTNRFVMMDYRTLNAETQNQYKLQHDPNTRTNDLGLRVYNDGERDYYLIGMGRAYGIEKGNAYLITLENGHSFYAMLGDTKGWTKWGHLCRNYQMQDCMNVIEFIVDMNIVPKKNVQLGGLDHDDSLPFDANIQSIEFLGNKWKK